MSQAEDVEFVLAHDRRFKFHSSVLARHSTLLADMLTERKAVTLSKRAKQAGVTTRYLIALTKIPTIDKPGGALELVELNSMGEPKTPLHPLILNENGRIPTNAFRHYEMILYAFYGHALKIANDSMETALSDALELISIGEYLGCLLVISKPIDVALVAQGQDLFRSIQNMPWSWISLAMSIKSELIFKEAVVHLAGNWRVVQKDKTAMARLKGTGRAVTLICEKMHKRNIDKAVKLELALMALYPGGLAAPGNELPVKREEYARDVLVWIALSFFRHWLGQRIISDLGSRAQDGGYVLYSQLVRAGDAYMDKPVIKQFHAKFPMTQKAMNILENHLLEIKECVKAMVKKHAVLKTESMLDVGQFPIDYLTCAEFDREDFPWLEADEELGARVGLEKGFRKPKGREIRMTGNEIVKQNLEAQRLAATGGYESVGEDLEGGDGEHNVVEEDFPRERRPGKRPRYE